MKYIYGFLLAALALFGLYATYVENKRWDKYAREHSCKVTGTVAGSTTYGYTSSGTMFFMDDTPKEIWSCADGTTHTRTARAIK